MAVDQIEVLFLEDSGEVVALQSDRIEWRGKFEIRDRVAWVAQQVTSKLEQTPDRLVSLIP